MCKRYFKTVIFDVICSKFLVWNDGVSKRIFPLKSRLTVYYVFNQCVWVSFVELPFANPHINFKIWFFVIYAISIKFKWSCVDFSFFHLMSKLSIKINRKKGIAKPLLPKERFFVRCEGMLWVHPLGREEGQRLHRLCWRISFSFVSFGFNNG